MDCGVSITNRTSPPRFKGIKALPTPESLQVEVREQVDLHLVAVEGDGVFPGGVQGRDASLQEEGRPLADPDHAGWLQVTAARRPGFLEVDTKCPEN